MMKPTKQAYLKHDLFKIVIPNGMNSSSYTAEQISEAIAKISYRKIASKGMKFVWCETQPDPMGRLIPRSAGWYADAGTGLFVAGNCGFGEMTWVWGNENLTESEPFKPELKYEDENAEAN